MLTTPERGVSPARIISQMREASATHAATASLCMTISPAFRLACRRLRLARWQGHLTACSSNARGCRFGIPRRPRQTLPPAASIPAYAGRRPEAGRGATRELPVMIQYHYANHSQPPIGPAMRPADLILGTCETPMRNIRPSISNIAIIACEVNTARGVDSAKDARHTPNAGRRCAAARRLRRCA